MKYRKEIVLDGTFKQVWDAREKRFEHPEKFPEMKHQKVIEKREEGNKLFQKREIELSASIPKALQRVLSEEMMKCIDDSVYDLETGIHTWSVKSMTKNSIFKCTGYSKYTEFETGGETKTRRLLEIEVKVNLPVIGSLAEQVIMEAYKKSLMKDNESIAEMVKMMKDGNG